MIEAYKDYWKNGVNFNDRATPGEFWWPILVNIIIGIILFILTIYGFILMINYGSTSFYVFGISLAIFNLANFLPALSVTIRRLHDLGLNWLALLLFIVLNFIPIVNIVVQLLWLILFMLPSDQFSDWDNFLSWDDNL